jgi:hypothetical protein
VSSYLREKALTATIASSASAMVRVVFSEKHGITTHLSSRQLILKASKKRTDFQTL